MLKKNFLRNFIIVCLLWLIASGVSLYLSHQQIGQGIKIQIQSYLSLWEDEFYQEQIQSSNKKAPRKNHKANILVRFFNRESFFGV